jgi:TolB-like protein
VLPFVNLSGTPDEDYFADAITADLTNDLSRISGSFVIARNTAFTFKGKSLDIRQVGRDLGVRYAVEGSVRRNKKNNVRMNAQLIDTGTGAHILAERFDGDQRELYQLENEFTSRLARTLNLQLIELEGRRALRERANNPDAVDLAMRGQMFLNRPRTVETFTQARDASA